MPVISMAKAQAKPSKPQHELEAKIRDPVRLRQRITPPFVDVRIGRATRRNASRAIAPASHASALRALTRRRAAIKLPRKEGRERQGGTFAFIAPGCEVERCFR